MLSLELLRTECAYYSRSVRNLSADVCASACCHILMNDGASAIACIARNVYNKGKHMIMELSPSFAS